MSLQHNHPLESPITVEQVKCWQTTCPLCTQFKAERDEFLPKAVLIYQRLLGHLPFYQARMSDTAFWVQYVDSRVTEARDLVAAEDRKAAKAE